MSESNKRLAIGAIGSVLCLSCSYVLGLLGEPSNAWFWRMIGLL